MAHLPPQVVELEKCLPLLKSRQDRGEFKGDARKSKSVEFADSLIQQAKRYANGDGGRALSASQIYWVERLIRRARGVEQERKVDKPERGDKTQSSSSSPSQVDVGSVVSEVMRRVSSDVRAQTTEHVLGMSEALSREVLAKALKELEERVPRKVVYEVKGVDKKTREFADVQHCKFEHLLKAASTRLPSGYVPGIFLQGEASSGKTTACKMLAKMLGLKWHFNGAISFPHEMLGFIDGAGKYHRTPFREAYEHGGVYTFDEVDRSDPVALLAVNPHLANGVATFPDGQVTRHKDCIIIGTANTWGLGADANYSGATKLDAAFLSRFPVRISWDIDPVLEDAIVGHPAWLKKVRAARNRARQVGLKVMIDTRAAQAGAALIAAGYSLDEAAEMTYLANLKPDQRKQLAGVEW